MQEVEATRGDGSGAGETRARPRWRLGLVCGVITSALVVVLVLVAAVLALFASGMVPLTGLQRHVAQDLERRLGPGWTVSAGDAAIRRVDGSPVLSVTQAHFEHSSGLRLRAPDVRISYDALSVLRGDVRIRAMDIHGVALRLKLNADGGVVLDTGDALVPVAAHDAPAQPLERALAALAHILDGDGLLPGLDRIALTGASLTLVTPAGSERTVLDRATLRLDPTAAGRELRLVGAAGTAEKDIALSSKRDLEGRPLVQLTVNKFRLDEIEGLLGGAPSGLVSGFPVSGVIVASIGSSAPDAITGTLGFGAGRIASPDGGPDSLGFSDMRISFVSDLALTSVSVPQIAVMGQQTALAMNATWTRTGSLWRLTGAGSGQFAGEGQDSPHVLTEAALTLSGEGLERATLDDLMLKGPGFNITGRATVQRTPDGPESTLNLAATQSSARAVLAAWPAIISPIIRRLLLERVEAGVVDTLDFAMTLSPSSLRAALVGDPTPDESLNVSAKGRGLRFMIAPGLPVLQDLALSALGTGRTFSVTGASGRVVLERGRALSLSEGAFQIADTWSKRPIGRATFRAQGGVDALAALLASPGLREAAPGQVDPEVIKGRIDLRNTVSLPLVDHIKPSDVIVSASGTINGLASESLLGREPLEAGNLAAVYERGVLSLRGDARIGGTPAQIDLRQDGRGVGEAVVTMTLDQAARQRRGLGLNNAVTGPMPLRIVQPLGRKPDALPRVEVDLARAAIDGLLPGWTKPAGRPGRLSFVLDDRDDDSTTLSDIVLEASPVLIRGRATIADNGTLEAASFSQFRVSPGDDIRLDLRREAGALRATVRGQVLDIRPLLRPMMSPTGNPRGSDMPPDLDVDLSVPIVTGFNSEVIGNAALKLSLRGKETRQLELTGRLGRAPVNLTQTREGEARFIRLTSEDGGGLLRFVDLYRRAYGGQLLIEARPRGEGTTGTLSLSNFRVQGEPALRRVISEQAPAPGPDGTRAAPRPAANPDNAQFQRLKASFTRAQGRLELRDAVIWGNEVGVTGQGSIDFARDRVDIAGTFVPGYLLNNAFSQVPILGPLLGGGQYEGLFAVNFRVSGSASQPSMTINPLSAIAPGILRRFVDPLGGVPMGQSAGQPRVGDSAAR